MHEFEELGFAGDPMLWVRRACWSLLHETDDLGDEGLVEVQIVEDAFVDTLYVVTALDALHRQISISLGPG